VTLTPARRAAAIAAGVAAVLLLGLLTYLTTRRGRDAAAWVAHTYEVLVALEAAQGRAVDAETGVRGYAATGARQFLEPYEAAERDVNRELARLRRLTLDNPAQQRRLDTLEVRAGAVFGHLDSVVAARAARVPDVADVTRLLAAGKGRMDVMRTAAAAVGVEERRLLAEREAEDRRLLAVTGWVVLGETLAAASCVLVAGLLLAAAARAERRHAAAEHTARVAAEEARQDAEDSAAQLEEQAIELEQRTEDAERHRSDAERANRTRTDFLASMSHELRTPLNAIQGYVQLLEEGLYGPLPEVQRDVLGRVRRAQAHLLGLVNDVLSFARLEEGRVAFDVRETPVSEVVQAVLPLVEPQLAAKGLVLDVSLPEHPARGGSPVRVWADRDKLAQVLLNLLANAVKFTPALQPDGTPGRVTVMVGGRGATPEMAYLRVHDTGIGIPRDQQDAVFEPFVQVSTGLTRTSDGTGLGLAISRDLVRGMGGDLRVRSAPGQGSAFTVSLRRVDTPAAEASPAGASPADLPPAETADAAD
jgi:signal transduction histidine kinase